MYPICPNVSRGQYNEETIKKYIADQDLSGGNENFKVEE
jgi:hypothetical protein